MGKRYRTEFRNDVVRVARKAQSSKKQIAKDFGISEPALCDWLKKADVEDGLVTPEVDTTETRELKKRNRLLEQENEVLRRAAIYLGKGVLPK